VITLYHSQWESLNMGAAQVVQAGPLTCELCIQRLLSSAYFGSNLTAPGAPLASAGVRNKARLHITVARPIVGSPIYRPWPVRGWRLQRALQHFFHVRGNSLLARAWAWAWAWAWASAMGRQAGMDCDETIRAAGPLHFSRSLHDEPQLLLPYSLAQWLQMSSGRSRRRKTQPRALRWA
jgi:hypothetical protein